MRTLIALGGVLCLCLAVFVVPNAAQVSHPQESTPTIRTSTTEVLLDLVVRDKQGRQVKNLEPSAVEVFEDGVKQEIRSFRLVEGREIHEQMAKDTVAAPGSLPASLSRLHPINLVCLVFSVDNDSKKFAVEAAQEFLKNEMRPGTYAAVFSLDYQLNALQQFTNNRDLLAKAVKYVSTGQYTDFAKTSELVLNASRTTMVLQGSQATGMQGIAIGGSTLDMTNPATATAGVDADTGAAATIMRGILVAQRDAFGGIQSMMELEKLDRMVEQLGRLPGRKTVLFFKPGMWVGPGDTEQFQGLIGRANRYNVSFYGIDVRGLTQYSTAAGTDTAIKDVARTSKNQSSDSTSVGEMMGRMHESDNLRQGLQSADTQATLRVFAESTGGRLIANTNDVKKPLQRVMEDIDTHYELAYHPTSGSFDGHFRKILVKADRRLVVQSRTGYFALPEVSGAVSSVKTFEMPALAALSAQPRPHAFDFQSAAIRFRTAENGSQYVVAFEVPGSSPTATPVPGQNKSKLHVSLLALIKDANGQVAGKVSQDFPAEVAADRLAALRASTMTSALSIGLAPGHYTVETAVVDREGDKASTNVFPIDIPAGKGIGMSNVVLVQRVEPVTGKPDASDPFQFQGQRVVPELATTLPASAQPSVYFVVYPDKSKTEKTQIDVQFLLEGQVLAQKTAELPPPDAAGAIPMVIGAVGQAGNWELKFKAIQGNDSAAQSIKYTIAAK